jgi:hypothetical protein
MAKVRQNIVVQGLSGSLGGQLTIRQDKAGRTIVSTKRTTNPNQVFSEAQKQHQDAFREAAAYAQTVKDQPVYIEKAAGTPLNAFNVAMADWFRAPEILEMNLEGWNGQAGEFIRIRAMDDVQVRAVHVAIKDGNDAVLEQGAAVRVEGLWWEYTTTGAGGEQVTANAEDLPGHTTEMTKAK